MPSTYTPSTAGPFPAGIILPADGDPRTASSVNVPLEGVADGAAYTEIRTRPLANLAALTAIPTPTDGLVRLVRGQGLYVFDTSASASLSPFALAADDATAGAWVAADAHQTTKSVVMHPSNSGSLWTVSTATTVLCPPSTLSYQPILAADFLRGSTGSVAFQRVNTGTTASWPLIFGLTDFMIDGATLSSAVFRIFPAGHASLPAVMPKVGIWRTPVQGTADNLLSTSGGLAVDTTALAANYGTSHDIVYTPDQNNVIDRSLYTYQAVVWTEASTNAQVNLAVYGVTLSFTIPDSRRT